ncbi:MAG: hypothetical protein HZA88_21630 [Verrucomicrobia bacterium]|nr:hypothetical protein [Verrucomicrobiota bacterium]
MRIALLATVGVLSVIALAFVLHLSRVKPSAPPESGPVPPRAAAAAPNPAKLQQVLAQQSNEIRRLRKEKSVLLSELDQHMTELAKPEPKSSRAGDPAAAPRRAGMGKMIAVAVRQQADLKLAALKSRLRLTDEQAAAVQALLSKQAEQQAEMASKMYDGKLTAEDMSSGAKFNLDEQLKQILTPEQWTGYQQYKTDEQRQQVQLATQAELMQLSPVLQLNAQQQEQVTSILQQQYQQYIGRQGASPVPASGNWEQMLDAKKEALRAVLTAEQQQSYEKFIESQREMIKSMMPQSQPASTP